MVPGHFAATVMAQCQQCVEYLWAQHFVVPLTVKQLVPTHFLFLQFALKCTPGAKDNLDCQVMVGPGPHVDRGGPE